MVKKYDIIIIGAGASGLWAARSALMREKKVAILEMCDAPGRKVAISGGGQCNITNTAADYTRYFGKNPRFVRSALTALKPADILNWAESHKLKLYEKTPGRYFCKNGAVAVVDALMYDARNANIFWNTNVIGARRQDDLFYIDTSAGVFQAGSLVIATGGTSFGSVGVSDGGLKIAKYFGHKIIPVRPALCAMAFKYFPADFAGISTKAEIKIGKYILCDDLLFTHFGIGGPLAYRASLHNITDNIVINLIPETNLFEILMSAKQSQGRKKLSTILSKFLPIRIAKWIAGTYDDKNIADLNKDTIKSVVSRTQNIVIPGAAIKYHNMQSAEVVRGGVATDDISSKTMESKLCPGLFFAGEVIDIAGDLGGFNLHWAWASGHVAGTHA